MKSVARWLTLGTMLTLGACAGGRSAPAGAPSAQTDQTLSQLFNLSAVYQRMGRLASTGSLSFVGNLAYLAGAGDSTNVVVGLSFENRSLSFQRDGSAFAARYQVEMTLARDAGDPIRVSRNEIVRVPTFQETQRGDETIFFQQSFRLPAGPYTLRAVVRDPTSNNVGQVEQVVTVPELKPGSITTPVMVYEVLPRRTAADSVYLIINPRGTVAHGGGDTLLVYVEANGLPQASTLPVEVRDEQDSVVYRTEVRFAGGREVEGRVVRLPADAPPLGELSITVGTPPNAKTTKALVSFARGWVVTNYDNLLSLLRYFPYRPDLVSALRNARPADRPALWRRFWAETDPDPSTGENEALSTYFNRVAIANEEFRDEGGEGWRTDRGEVFITLGHPDQIYESPPGNDRRYVRWVYNQFQAIIDFEGTMGYSRMRMTTESRSEFIRARSQLLRELPRR